MWAVMCVKLIKRLLLGVFMVYSLCAVSKFYGKFNILQYLDGNIYAIFTTLKQN